MEQEQHPVIIYVRKICFKIHYNLCNFESCVAHIKDLVSGGWFECNDEKIEKIDQEGYSQTLVMRSEGTILDCTLPTCFSCVCFELIEESGESELQANPSSKGAYMLVYTREEYFNRTHADPELPQFLADLVKREDSVFEAEQEEERKVKAMESHRRAQRQAQVDLLFKSKYPQEAIQNENRNPVANPVIHELRNGTLPREVQEGLHFRNPACIANIDFISTQWLEKWLKYSETDIPPISNEDIICGHEKLRPPRKGDMNTMYKIIPSHIVSQNLLKNWIYCSILLMLICVCRLMFFINITVDVVCQEKRHFVENAFSLIVKVLHASLN